MRRVLISIMVCLLLTACLLSACDIMDFPDAADVPAEDPAGSVSTDPTTPPVSIPSDPGPASTPPNSSYERLPNGEWPNPWENYLYEQGETRNSILEFYPKGESVDLDIAPGADVVAYAESLGYTHYSGNGLWQSQFLFWHRLLG